MSVLGLFKGFMSSKKTDYGEELSVSVEVAGTLSEQVSERNVQDVKNLKIKGPLDGEDFTFLHRVFSKLERLDLSKATIVGGRFACHKHGNFYGLESDTLSRHSLHIGNLEYVVLPENVKEIVLSDFVSTSIGASADMSEYVRMSGAFPFSLKWIEVPETNETFSSVDGVLYDKKQTVLLKCPVSHEENITYPSTLERIEKNALRECVNIKLIDLPEGVVEVGEKAFYESPCLKTVVLPSTIRTIGDDIFSHCPKLSTVVCGNPEPVELHLFRSSRIASSCLKVPTDSVAAYEKASIWSEFKVVKGM